jgi:hypothetical protein
VGGIVLPAQAAGSDFVQPKLDAHAAVRQAFGATLDQMVHRQQPGKAAIVEAGGQGHTCRLAGRDAQRPQARQSGGRLGAQLMADRDKPGIIGRQGQGPDGQRRTAVRWPAVRRSLQCAIQRLRQRVAGSRCGAWG